MSEVALQEVPCALCGGERREPLFDKEGWRYVRCQDCRFQYVSPRHADSAAANVAFAEARDEYEGTGEGAARVGKRASKYRRRLARFERWRETGRFLEVGCREGHLLAVARDLGWEALGVEPEAGPAEVARESFGLDVHCGFLDGAQYPDDHVDVVYLNEVIEHVPDPVPLFGEIARVLRPGGAVYVKTGNCESLTARLYRGEWGYYAYHRIGHVSYYSPRLLERLFAEVGLQLVSARTWGLDLPGRRGLAKLARNAGGGLLVKAMGLGTHVEAIGEKRLATPSR